MTMSQNRVTLGTASQEVVGPSVETQFITMHNMSKSSNNFIHYGNSSVGTSDSPHMDESTTIQLRLLPGESLHALSNPAGVELGLLIQRQG